MRSRTLLLVLVMALAMPTFTGCTSSGHRERYTSPRIQGEAAKINLDEVQKAFWDTKGNDFKSWMGAFEKRINEIYDGKDVVAIDANRDSGHLVVTGFIPKTDKEGMQPGDEKLFSIEQTGEAVNNEVPYRVNGYNGYNSYPYYTGHHSIGSTILSMMLMSHMMNSWGGRYYTPPHQMGGLGQHRDSFRNSSAYTQQKAANQGFMSRFKTKMNGSLQSSKSFGGTPFSSSTDSSKNRSWGLFGGRKPSTDSSFGTSSGWAGRRSSGFSFGSSRSSGWGRRRR